MDGGTGKCFRRHRLQPALHPRRRPAPGGPDTRAAAGAGQRRRRPGGHPRHRRPGPRAPETGRLAAAGTRLGPGAGRVHPAAQRRAGAGARPQRPRWHRALFRRPVADSEIIPLSLPCGPLPPHPLGAPMSDTQKRIDDLVKSNDILLFMKGTASFPMCGFSGRAVQILKACGVDPKAIATVNVLDDDEIRQGIKDYSQWPTIPQLYIKGEFIGGSDIMMEMYESGELKQMLGTEG